jgi:tetratricopeptide (TPR) repeat protein
MSDFEAALQRNGLDTVERRQIEAAKDSLKKLTATRQVAKLLESGNKLLDRDDRDDALNAAELDHVISGAHDALRLDPSSHSATHLLSVALIRAGRRDEALGALSQAIERGGDVGALLAERGFLLRDMGDFVGARRDFLSAMKGYSR